MILSKLKLDEENELEFSMQVFGTSEQASDIRFIIMGEHYDVVLHGEYVNETVKVKVPKMKNLLPSGIHECKMEIIIDGKIFSPLSESIEFEPLVELDVKSQTKNVIKESVKIEPLKVTARSPKGTKIDEAKAEGYDIIEYGGLNVLKKDNRFFGIVSETKSILSEFPYASVDELIDSLK